METTTALEEEGLGDRKHYHKML